MAVLADQGVAARRRVAARHNLTDTGRGPVLVFAHGFGCDQTMWQFVTPAFADCRTVLYDLVGSGGSDLAAYSPGRYASLEAHAEDLLGICEALDLRDVVFVGHSVAATIGMIAAAAAPDRFRSLVLVAPSPRYMDDAGYVGGLTRESVEEFLIFLDQNPLGWANLMAPVIMGNTDRPELSSRLARSFCRTDPAILSHFARVTFLGDHRGLLPRVTTPSLILQCARDAVAPPEVGRFMARTMPAARLVELGATGHCPHLSAPEEVASAIRSVL